MIINGHEVERQDGRMRIDGRSVAFFDGTADADYYREHAVRYRRDANDAELIAEFRRREEYEKQQMNEDRERDRKARMVVHGWYGVDCWNEVGKQVWESARRVVDLMEKDTKEHSNVPTVEIGGEVMTQAQYDAARFPLLNPAPDVVQDERVDSVEERVRAAVKQWVDLDEYPTSMDWERATNAACAQDMTAYSLARDVISALHLPAAHE
jgi:hypothetical protein